MARPATASPSAAAADPRLEARRSRMPSTPEAIGVIVLLALALQILLPGVTIAPYQDPLRNADASRLRERASDSALPAHLRLRALTILEEREGTAVAVRAAIDAVRTEGSTQATPTLLAFLADRPSAAIAGDVLEAWQTDVLPDEAWRTDFLGNGWAPASAWFAVPMLATTTADQPRMIWMADVLAGAGEQRFRVPAGPDGEGAREATGPELLADWAFEYLQATRIEEMNVALEQRVFANLLAVQDAGLSVAMRGLADQAIDSGRLPAGEGVNPGGYARAVLDLRLRWTNPDNRIEFLRTLAAESDGPRATYARFAAERLEE